MPKLEFAEINPEAFTPLEEQERCDAYYHMQDKLGVSTLKRDLETAERLRPKQKKEYILGITAESLATLPDVRGDTILDFEEAEEPVVPTVAEEEKEILPPIKTYATPYAPAERGAPAMPAIQVDGQNVETTEISFKGSLAVTASCPTTWSTVRYTLETDNAITPRSSLVLDESLVIDRSLTLRCAACKRGWLSDEVAVRFVREDLPENHPLPALVPDQDDQPILSRQSRDDNNTNSEDPDITDGDPALVDDDGGGTPPPASSTVNANAATTIPEDDPAATEDHARRPSVPRAAADKRKASTSNVKPIRV